MGIRGMGIRGMRIRGMGIGDAGGWRRKAKGIVGEVRGNAKGPAGEQGLLLIVSYGR
jgi:hypothetical protein